MGDELGCVVRVFADGDFRGSGFLITPERVLTCKHVVVERNRQTGTTADVACRELRVQARDGPQVSATFLDPSWDLALLELKGPIAAKVPPFLWGITRSLEEKLRAANLTVVGYPRVDHQGESWHHQVAENFHSASYRDGSQTLMQLQLPGGIPTGCSGGPMLFPLRDGWAYAGILYLGGEGAASSRLIMADVLLEFLAKAGLDLAGMERVDATEAIERPESPLSLPNPYRGLQAFREEDAPYFRGREQESKELLDLVQKHPLVTLVGASGAGKSSLLEAGLLPLLRPLRGWYVTKFRPGKDPFSALAAALATSLYAESELEERTKKFGQLRREFAEHSLRLVELLEMWTREKPDRHLLLIADQLEELYTQPIPEVDRDNFIDQLIGPSREELPCTTLLCLRADFLGRVLDSPLSGPFKARPKQYLAALKDKALLAAIKDPARELGVELETDLTERIVQDLGNSPGSLPLLEFALAELWKRQERSRLTHAAYEEIGGVKEALSRHADGVLARLKEREADLRRIFVQLVHPGDGTEDTRQVAMRDQIGEANWPLVQQLADKRLVVTDTTKREAAEEEAKAPTETVELVHEALIRHWQPLKGWVEADRKFRLWQNHLRQELEVWEETKRGRRALLRGVRLAEAQQHLATRADEINQREREYIKASVRAQRRTVSGLVAALAFFIALAVFAFIQQQSAEKARKVALARQLAAQANLLVERGGVNQIMERAAALAVESWRRTKNADAHAVAAKLLSWTPVITIDRDPAASGSRGVFPEAFIMSGGPGGVEMNFARDNEEIQQLAISPNGRFVAIHNSKDGSVRLISVRTGIELRRLDRSMEVRFVFSPDSRRLLAFSRIGSKKVAERLIDTGNGKELLAIDTDHPDNSPFPKHAFSPDSRWLAVGRSDAIQIIDTRSGEELNRVDGEGKPSDFLFSPNEGLLVVSGKVSHRMIELPSGQERLRIPETGKAIHVQFVADGSHLAIESCKQANDCGETILRVFEVASGNERISVDIAEDEGVNLKDDHLLVIRAVREPEVRVIEIPDGKEVIRFDAQNDVPLRTARMSKGGHRLFLMTKAGTAQVIDVATGQELFRFDQDCEYETSESFTENTKTGAVVASCKDDRVVTLNSATGLAEAKFTLEGSFLGFSPDARLLATTSENDNGVSVVRIVETATGRELTRIPIHSTPMFGRTVVFSQEGRHLAVAGRQSEKIELVRLFGDKNENQLRGDAYVIDLSGLHSLARLEIANTDRFAGTGDGKVIAVSGGDRFVRLFDIDMGRETAVIAHDSRAEPIAFSADGERLLTRDGDSLRLFHVSKGRILAQLRKDEPVHPVIFSPDGRFLVMRGSKSAGLLDITSLRELTKFAYKGDSFSTFLFNGRPQGGQDLPSRSGKTAPCEQRNGVRRNGKFDDVAFGPNSQLLAMVSAGDGTVRLIDTATGKEQLCLKLNAKPQRIAFGPDGKTIAIGVLDNSVRLIDVATGTERLRLKHELSPQWKGTATPNFSPDGRRLAVIDSQAFYFHVLLFDTKDGHQVMSVASRATQDDRYPKSSGYYIADFDPDGRLFAVGGRLGDPARIFDSSTGDEISRIELGVGPKGVKFSPHGRYLRCRPWRARRRPVVRGRRQRVRVTAVAKGAKGPVAGGGHMQSAIRHAVELFVGAVALRGVERRCDRRTSAAQTRLSPLPESRRRRTHPAEFTRVNATRRAAFNWAGRVGLLEIGVGNEPAYVQHADAVNEIVFSPDRHDVLTCPSSTLVGYVEDGKFHQHRATLRGAGHEQV